MVLSNKSLEILGISQLNTMNRNSKPETNAYSIQCSDFPQFEHKRTPNFTMKQTTEHKRTDSIEDSTLSHRLQLHSIVSTRKLAPEIMASYSVNQIAAYCLVVYVLPLARLARKRSKSRGNFPFTVEDPDTTKSEQLMRSSVYPPVYRSKQQIRIGLGRIRPIRLFLDTVDFGLTLNSYWAYVAQ